MNMEQTIKINVPDGKKAIYNNETQTIEFIDIESTRSKSWEEFCKNHPVTSDEFYICNTGKITKHLGGMGRKDCINQLATKEDAEGIFALIQLTRLHDEWVGDWKPVTKKDYYAITYNITYKTIGVGQWWHTHQLLSFPVREVADEFLECFKDLIEKSKKIYINRNYYGKTYRYRAAEG